MHRMIAATALTAVTNLATAQAVDWDRIIPPPEAVVTEFEERLVQLAWENYSANRVFEHNMQAADKAVGMARWTWLEDIEFKINVNPRTIEDFGNFQVPESGDANLFPWYNFGVTINPSIFVTTPGEVRLAEFEAAVARDNLKAQKLAIRSETLQRYAFYEHNLEQLKHLSEAYETANSTFILMREKFNKGDAELEDFNDASAALVETQTGKMEGELQLKLTRIRVEEMIGLRLEEVAR